MRNFLRWPIALLLLIASSSWSCEEVKIQAQKRELSLCYNPQDYSFYSRNCQNASKCLPLKEQNFDLRPNQSPGFSACYHLEGKPFFAKFKDKVYSFCEKDGKVIDIESLLKLSKIN